MEKVELTQEQIDIIEQYKAIEIDAAKIEAYLNSLDFKRYKDGKGIDLDTFIKAVYFGYFPKLTPEEKILTLYNAHADEDEPYDTGYQTGIQDVLKIINLRIKGINV